MPLEWFQLYLVFCCGLSEHEAFTTLHHVITQMITWQRTYDYIQEVSKAAGWTFAEGDPYETRAFRGDVRIVFGLIRRKHGAIKFWFATDELDLWELAENRCLRGKWNDDGSMRKEDRLSLSPIELVFQIRDVVNNSK